MLENIGFKGGGPRASAGDEPLKGVVALNFHHQADIQYNHHYLPQPFRRACPNEVPVPIHDQDEGLPGELLCKVTLAEVILDHTEDLLPEI